MYRVPPHPVGVLKGVFARTLWGVFARTFGSTQGVFEGTFGGCSKGPSRALLGVFGRTEGGTEGGIGGCTAYLWEGVLGGY